MQAHRHLPGRGVAASVALPPLVMPFSAITDIRQHLLRFTPIDIAFTEVTRISQKTLCFTQLLHGFERRKSRFHFLFVVGLLGKVVL